MIRAVLLLALTAVLLSGGTAFAQLLPFTHYTTESEPRALPSAEVHAVHQDRQGFVWAVVYSSGLVRYDGVRMELYTRDDGLRSLSLWDVHEDAAGRLWVSSNEGLVVSERPLPDYAPWERIRFVADVNGTALLDVAVRRNVMSTAPDGTTWVGTDALGIVRYHFEEDQLRSDTLLTGIPNRGDAGSEPRPVRTILARQDGSMWVGLTGGTLLRFSPDGTVERVEGDRSPERTVFALYEDAAGTLWGGNLGGLLWRLRENGGDYSFDIISTTLTGTVNGIRATADGRLFASSEGTGVLVFTSSEPDRQRVYDRRNGLISDVVHGVLVDSENNIWIAQSGGLSKLRHNHAAFQSFNARSQIGERPILPAPSVSSVQPAAGDSPCAIWVGTTGGGVACVHADGGGSTYLTTAEGLSNEYVNAVALDGYGRLWMGTSRGIDALVPAGVAVPQGGIAPTPIQIGGTAYRVVRYVESTAHSAVVLQMPNLHGDGRIGQAVWFGGARSVFGLVEDEWFRLGEAAGLPSAIMHAVAVDDAGHLWVGTRDQGLYRSNRPITGALLDDLSATSSSIDGSSFGRDVTGPVFDQIWSSAEEAPTDQIESLLWAEGTMWVATPAGLFALQYDAEGSTPRVAAHIDQQNGLGAAHVYSLAVSPVTGTLWAGTNGGITEIDRDTKTALRTVTRRHGLIDNEVWYFGSVRIDDQGRVHFGTAQGLSIYDPQLDAAVPEVGRIHLRRADLTRDRQGHNEAQFEYAAMSFASGGSILYRTRLRGYERDWSAPTSEAKIRYTNLPAIFRPREYTFEVIASNAAGEWMAAPEAYTFHVDPPWWLQWWMFLVYGGVLLGGLAGADRIQRRRLIMQMKTQSRLREAEYRAEQAATEQEAAEARARALQAENDRKEAELTKARELELAYNELKAAQAQLIQAEKMASLGQLTAGIAHEIKNPLNFVNNFSRASVELLEELREELDALAAGGSPDAVSDLMSDLTTMAEKVAEHGERADRIVKSMLQHSRGSSGTLQEENINTYVEEYVNLAYHGMRAQHSEFNVDIVREYDTEAGVVPVVSQEFGRVLINLLNNAFYAVHQQKKALGPTYSPKVTVRTHRNGSIAALEIEDNGPGIPESVRKRIFEPFFTTKPTGEGTGLGLSLSYDIITQMHGGQLHVSTKEGSGTTFSIELPVNAGDRRHSVVDQIPEDEL